MRKVYVHARCELTPGDPKPDYRSLFSVLEARRMGRLLKRAVWTADQALQQAGISVPDAVIVGTDFGCIENSERFLSALKGIDDAPLRPTHFMQSTHNTIVPHRHPPGLSRPQRHLLPPRPLLRKRPAGRRNPDRPRRHRHRPRRLVRRNDSEPRNQPNLPRHRPARTRPRASPFRHPRRRAGCAVILRRSETDEESAEYQPVKPAVVHRLVHHCNNNVQ